MSKKFCKKRTLPENGSSNSFDILGKTLPACNNLLDFVEVFGKQELYQSILGKKESLLILIIKGNVRNL